MINDESMKIASKTWLRSADHLFKMGYMDGASDGQAISYQASFDKGFRQGLQFGFKIGFSDALKSFTESHNDVNLLIDPRRINCQICINKNVQEKLDNIVNIQEEKNFDYLNSINR